MSLTSIEQTIISNLATVAEFSASVAEVQATNTIFFAERVPGIPEEEKAKVISAAKTALQQTREFQQTIAKLKAALK